MARCGGQDGHNKGINNAGCPPPASRPPATTAGILNIRTQCCGGGETRGLVQFMLVIYVMGTELVACGCLTVQRVASHAAGRGDTPPSITASSVSCFRSVTQPSVLELETNLCEG